MLIHLRCPCCPCHFSAPARLPAAEVLERMAEDAPWFALAEGETFADMLHSALARRGKLLCPICRGEVLVDGQEPDPDMCPDHPFITGA
jgi:hypothetical protein